LQEGDIVECPSQTIVWQMMVCQISVCQAVAERLVQTSSYEGESLQYEGVKVTLLYKG
jgi:hypothetical protein